MKKYIVLAAACVFVFGFAGLVQEAQAAVPASVDGIAVEHVSFASSNTANRWDLIRGQLGPRIVIDGSLMRPKNTTGNVPVVVMSHGSDGITSGMFDVWAKPLLEAGYAVFMVDSFPARNVAVVSGTPLQLTWNTTLGISDAIYALKLLSDYPGIDPHRIYHLGWSRGGNAVTGAMWSNYRQMITKSADIKWAGSIAMYPGCNIRYINHSKLEEPVLYLLGGKDDMTPATACVEEAKQLAAEGHDVTYKVFPNAYHVFDRLNQPYRQFKEGNYAKCALDVQVPTSASDPSPYGPAHNDATHLALITPADFISAVHDCQRTSWITVESDPEAREEAVKDVLAFMEKNKGD